ncbi:MAG: RNA polymerase sigma factor [Anaerolineae bacterium]|nr:RNA polymerase sigma factor [Anaerolineae bacterium]
MDLVKHCLAGEEAAFDALYRQYARLVYHTAYLMLDHPQDADDVLQEVFLRVFQHLDTYDPAKGALSTWLHRITVNVYLRHIEHPGVPSVPLTDSLVGATQEPVDAALDNRQRLQQLLSELEPAFRAVVVLRFYSALSYSEIAEVLEVPVGTVQSRLNRALRRLRQREEVQP